MKWWNKQTLNADGDLYESGVRSIERPEDWNNVDNLFTKIIPPAASLNSRVPCTWDEENQAWILDTEKNELFINQQVAIQAFINSPFNNVTIATAHNYINQKVPPSGATEEINNILKLEADMLIGLREVLRSVIKKVIVS